ncbi:MAG: helix-turn-helix domain-containing protein [Nitrospiria bacterium]
MEGIKMLENYIKEAGKEYKKLRHLIPIGVLRSEEDYDKAVRVLDAILDEIGKDESHLLTDLAETLSFFIEAYDKNHFQIPKSNPKKILRYLMNEHGLKQSDLPEIGSQGVVSEVLGGKRDLNARQISKLVKRFHVPADLFI